MPSTESTAIIAAAPLPERLQMHYADHGTDEQQMALARNKFLAPNVRRHLLTRKPKSKLALAKDVIGMQLLTSDDVTALLERDTRAGVLAQLLSSHPGLVTDAVLAAAIDAAPKQKSLAGMLIDPGHPFRARIDDATALELLAAAGGKDMLEAFSDNPMQFADPVELFVDTKWLPRGRGREMTGLLTDALYRLTDTARAELFARCEAEPASIDERVWAAIAGSRFPSSTSLQEIIVGLDGDTLARTPSGSTALKALHNPVFADDVVRRLIDAVLAGSDDTWLREKMVEGRQIRFSRGMEAITGTFETESDPAKLAWLMKRTVGNLRFGPVERPLDVIALAANPNINEFLAAEILPALSHWASREKHPLAELRAAVDTLVDRHPHLAAPDADGLVAADKARGELEGDEIPAAQIAAKECPVIVITEADIGRPALPVVKDRTVEWLEERGVSAFYDKAEIGAWLIDEVGDDPDVWTAVLSFLDQNPTMPVAQAVGLATRLL